MIQRREYVNSGHPQAIIRDWLIRPLGLTISQYVGSSWGFRPLGRRIGVDIGRYSLLFWGLSR